MVGVAISGVLLGSPVVLLGDRVVLLGDVVVALNAVSVASRRPGADTLWLSSAALTAAADALRAAGLNERSSEVTLASENRLSIDLMGQNESVRHG